jgi:hypothetical protein
MKTMKIEKSVAEKIIHTSDHDKAGFLKYAFNSDWLDPHLYDITINTDKLSKASAVKIIVEAAQSEEIKACSSDAVAILGKLSMQRKIESALLEAGVMSLRTFFIVEDMETVRFYGIVHTEEEKEKIEKVVREIKDIKKVKNDLTVMRF